MKRVLLAGTILLALNVNAAQPSGINIPVDIDINAAWIREAPPVASVQAGYFMLCNRHADSAALLERVESDAFGRIEMHETVETDGSSRMVKLDSLTIPAGDCISFERGGKHLMLFEPANRLVDGDAVTLHFVVDGNRIEHEFPVRRGNADMPEDNNAQAPDHNHHHGH